MHDFDLYKKIHRIFIILGLSILLTLVIPGSIIYFSNNGFFENSLVEHLSDTVKNKIDSVKSRKEFYRTFENEIVDSLILLSKNSNGSSSKFDMLMKARELTGMRLSEIKNPYTLSPFHMNKVVWGWVFSYFILGVMVFVINPSYVRTKMPGIRQILSTTIIVYPLWHWTTWFRNSSLGNDGRKVFSVFNIDVNPIGFWIQEIIIFFFCLLLSIFLIQNVMLLNHLKTKYSGKFDFFEFIKELKRTFMFWQLNSVLFSSVFLAYTYFFWYSISQNRDNRYIPHGIIVHLIWAISLFVITIPLIYLKNKWAEIKNTIIFDQQNSSFEYRPKDKTLFYNYVHQGNITSSVGQIVSTVIAIGSFIIPLLQLLKR